MKKTKKGFTLVELLVVIAIIAIIAAVAVPVTIGQINKSKVKTAKNEALNAFDIVEQAIADKGSGVIDADGFEAYLTANFAKPEYVKSIKIVANKGVTKSFTVRITTTDMKIDGNNDYIEKTLGADYVGSIDFSADGSSGNTIATMVINYTDSWAAASTVFSK